MIKRIVSPGAHAELHLSTHHGVPRSDGERVALAKVQPRHAQREGFARPEAARLRALGGLLAVHADDL